MKNSSGVSPNILGHGEGGKIYKAVILSLIIACVFMYALLETGALAYILR